MLYRRRNGRLEVLIVHMGGPFWARKDARAWSFPKGEFEAGDDPRAVAAREFVEELGSPLPDGPEIELGSVTQRWRQDGDRIRARGRLRREHDAQQHL